jgi:hypothetical protein
MYRCLPPVRAPFRHGRRHIEYISFGSTQESIECAYDEL